MNHNFIIIFSLSLVILLSCETRTSRQAENQEQTQTSEPFTISLKPVPTVTEHFDAILELVEPSGYDDIKVGEVRFVYDVRNFPLSAGNLITLNVDNEHYVQSKKPETSMKLERGSYLSVSFLCLPNQISLKNYGNYVIRHFKVGSLSEQEYDDTVPMIFYHYPRGRIEAGGDGVLLDFYLLNTELSTTGHKVKVELAGQEFTLTEWAPFMIEGLTKGDYNLKLTLVNGNGKIIDSPFNSVTGSFVLY